MLKGVVCCAIAAVLSLASARAEDFPSRYVTIVVPLATGGSTDTIARIIAEGMRPHLGQTVVVENTPGAGGATGVIRVARSTPDGYTVQIGQWGTNVAAGVAATDAATAAYAELLDGLEQRFADVPNATLRRKQARQAARAVDEFLMGASELPR